MPSKDNFKKITFKRITDNVFMGSVFAQRNPLSLLLRFHHLDFCSFALSK